MRKDLDDRLCEKYPKIFAERSMDAGKSNMGLGFSCGDGWFDIIDILCANLQFWTDRNGAPQSVATQVKEKFGMLQFYCSGGNELTFGMIVMALAMSARVCEVCGAPGRLKADDGWYQVRCDAHASQHEKEKDLEDFPAQ